MPDSGVVLDGFEKAKRDYDDKIRSLSTELNGLQMTKNDYMKQLDDLYSKIQVAKTELGVISDTLAKQKSDFEASKIPINKAISDQQAILTQQKAQQDQKDADQKNKDVELSGRLNTLQALKKELISQVRTMGTEINAGIEELVKTIGDV